MRIRRDILLATCVIVSTLFASAQGFVNLNFEQVTLTNTLPSGYGFNSGTGLVRGWTGYWGWEIQNYSNGMAVIYNNETLDASNVSVEGTNYWRPALSGKYSILLKGGSVPAGQVYPWMTNGASIGQTGQIPAGINSLTFWSDSSYFGFVVSFAGNVLPFAKLGDYPNYSIWGADISNYTGQTGELLFNAPWSNGGGMIDNIQFSSNAVPEPGTLALIVLASLILGVKHRNRFKKGHKKL